MSRPDPSLIEADSITAEAIAAEVIAADKIEADKIEADSAPVMDLPGAAEWFAKRLAQRGEDDA